MRSEFRRLSIFFDLWVWRRFATGVVRLLPGLVSSYKVDFKCYVSAVARQVDWEPETLLQLHFNKYVSLGGRQGPSWARGKTFERGSFETFSNRITRRWAWRRRRGAPHSIATSALPASTVQGLWLWVAWWTSKLKMKCVFTISLKCLEHFIINQCDSQKSYHGRHSLGRQVF